MDPIVVGVFVLVYLGMILGEFPRLAARSHRHRAARRDRAGRHRAASRSQAAWAPSTCRRSRCCSGLMVISAQFRLGGFYAAVTRRIGRRAITRRRAAGAGRPRRRRALGDSRQRHRLPGDGAGAASRLCARRGSTRCRSCSRSPARSNVGSAGTLIGNPQNMLIGEVARPLVRPVSAGRRCARRCSGSAWCGPSLRWRIASAGCASTPLAGGATRRRSIAGRR